MRLADMSGPSGRGTHAPRACTAAHHLMPGIVGMDQDRTVMGKRPLSLESDRVRRRLDDEDRAVYPVRKRDDWFLNIELSDRKAFVRQDPADHGRMGCQFLGGRWATHWLYVLDLAPKQSSS